METRKEVNALRVMEPVRYVITGAWEAIVELKGAAGWVSAGSDTGGGEDDNIGGVAKGAGVGGDFLARSMGF